MKRIVIIAALLGASLPHETNAQQKNQVGYIVGGGVLIVGGWASYKLYKLAKDKLGDPPSTNAPPAPPVAPPPSTNAPPKQKHWWNGASVPAPNIPEAACSLVAPDAGYNCDWLGGQYDAQAQFTVKFSPDLKQWEDVETVAMYESPNGLLVVETDPQGTRTVTSYPNGGDVTLSFTVPQTQCGFITLSP